MTKILASIFIIILLSGCAPLEASVQATWTPIPTYTPQSTYTFQPTFTSRPVVVVTSVVIQTPRPPNTNDCIPLTNMNYSDNSKVAVLLQAYVSQLPDVKSVSYTIPEKLYSNTLSEIFFVQYMATDGKNYAKRYLVYMNEFGWKTGTFSISGQCWIDPPH
jgi:hypothetical protein